MPFRDLSAGSGSPHIGEAIRETVTSDLKQIGSLRVIERGNLDKLLAEQKIQAHQNDVDVTTVVRLGKLLGASLIVVGAHQRQGPQVRLTARFVRVETAEVIGVAKVDGTSRDFLRLQDRVTAALLRSAGFKVHAKKIEDDAAGRPDLASIKTLELYGQAVLAHSDDERRQYLRAAVAEDQHFSYAARDLEELEQRLKTYQAQAQPLQEQELAALRAQIAAAKDPQAAATLELQLLARLGGLNRWHAVVREARRFLQGLPAGTPLSGGVDAVALMLVQYDGSLKDYDAVLRDGESYLKRATGSPFFTTISSLVQQAIESKRRIQEAKKRIEDELADPDKPEHWDLCRVGDLCRNGEQYEAALRFYELCGQVAGPNQKPRAELLPLLALSASNGGLWQDLHRLLSEWDRLDPREAQKWYVQYRGWMPEDE
jgi:TolB-like protein/uncharacterized protein YdcH (DUF465 family)